MNKTHRHAQMILPILLSGTRGYLKAGLGWVVTLLALFSMVCEACQIDLQEERMKRWW